MERKIDAFGDAERLDKMSEIFETHLLFGTLVMPNGNGEYMLCRVIPKSSRVPYDNEAYLKVVKRLAEKRSIPVPKELDNESMKTLMSMVYSQTISPDYLNEDEANTSIFNTIYKNVNYHAKLFALRTNPENDFDSKEFRESNDPNRMRSSNYILNYIKAMPENLRNAHMDLVFAAYKNYLSVLFTVEDAKLKEAMEQAGKRIGALCAAYDKDRFEEVENTVLESKL